jgi:hypothetical protein
MVSIVASAWSMRASIARHNKAWCSLNRPAIASSSWGILDRIRPLAISANTVASRSPAMSASIISRPDLVRTLDATDDNFTPASSRTLCNR